MGPFPVWLAHDIEGGEVVVVVKVMAGIAEVGDVVVKVEHGVIDIGGDLLQLRALCREGRVGAANDYRGGEIMKNVEILIKCGQGPLGAVVVYAKVSLLMQVPGS